MSLVSARNQKTDPALYMAAYPLELVREIHVAGHEVAGDEAEEMLLIDAHGSPVDDAVWLLYGQVIARTGPLPTLIERDSNVPALADLVAEARRADAVLYAAARRAA
jgi:hypothetical protein